jgi:glycosyltransferase involved in cell wall biosynthesis
MTASGVRDLISVVIATWQAEETIGDCLDSLVAQTAVDRLDVIVADGGSLDRTVSIVRGYGSRLRLRLHVASDRGIYDAWNQVLRSVKGDWIWFMGSDDIIWDGKVIEDLVPKLEGLPVAANFAFGPIGMGASRDRVDRWVNCRKSFDAQSARLREMPVGHTGLLQRRSLVLRTGPFDWRFRIAGDFDWMLRALERCGGSAHFHQLDRTLAFMHDGGVSSSLTGRLRAVQEYSRVLHRHQRCGLNLVLGRMLAAGVVQGLAEAAMGTGAAQAYSGIRRLYRRGWGMPTKDTPSSMSGREA